MRELLCAPSHEAARGSGHALILDVAPARARVLLLRAKHLFAPAIVLGEAAWSADSARFSICNRYASDCAELMRWG
jgi:hypothetical protein